mgnify:CR=1 FL=1
MGVLSPKLRVAVVSTGFLGCCMPSGALLRTWFVAAGCGAGVVIGMGVGVTAAATLSLIACAIAWGRAAASMGVLIPVIMEKFGRDPALGSSVLITAVTDSGGFMIFLGLATIFLL